jgi:hypothetical protein
VFPRPRVSGLTNRSDFQEYARKSPQPVGNGIAVWRKSGKSRISSSHVPYKESVSEVDISRPPLCVRFVCLVNGSD